MFNIKPESTPSAEVYSTSFLPDSYYIITGFGYLKINKVI
jgi:hypothetical protein